jgi:hypothetical protein
MHFTYTVYMGLYDSPVLLCIREVTGSNIGPEISYPDKDFSLFTSVPAGKCRVITLKLGHDRFLPNLFQFFIHLPPFNLTP